MNIAIRMLRESDLSEFVQLVKIFEEVFEMRNFSMPPQQHLQQLLADPKFMVFVAFDDRHKVVGGLTAYTLTQYYSTKPLVYIFDLAIATRHQRKGVGTQLIAAINAHCTHAGMQEVFVQADKVDAYALDFYRKNNPTAEEDVSHFYFTL